MMAMSDQGSDVTEPLERQWSIRAYQPGDEKGLVELFNAVFGVDRSLERWYWQFKDNPVGEQYIRVAVTESGDLVGHYGGIPVFANWAGQQLVITQVVDVMADPSVRGGLSRRSGIFGRMLASYIEECLGPGRAALGYGFPPIGNLRLGRQLGYRELHRVQTLAKRIAEHHSFSLPASIAGLGWVVEIVDDLHPVDDLWMRCRTKMPVAIVRDARYLEWRYKRHPEFHYHFVVVRRRLSQEWAGLAVLRLGVGKELAFLGQDETTACIVDWLVPPSERVAAELLTAECEAIGRRKGMCSLHTWFRPGSPYWDLFTANGYEPQPTPMYLTARPGIEGLSLEWARNHWYYTMGDSDLY